MKDKNTLKMQNKKRDHFFIIDNDYVKLYAKHLGVVATAVFTSLNMHADSEGKCFPSMELIAEQHNIDRHTVSRALKKLEKWNMISTKHGIDRRLKKRKNNVYELLPKELWGKLPNEDQDEDDNLGGFCDDIILDENNFWAWNDIDEDGKEDTINDHDKSHGNIDATHMASILPYDGTENTSNKKHIIRTIEENSYCGQEPTKTDSGNSYSMVSSEPHLWNSKKAILSLVNNDYKDYQIIGEYFLIQKFFFSSKLAFEKKLKRSLKAAKALKMYDIADIIKTMKWMNNEDFDMGWSLEAVIRNIDDCISTDFIPDTEERTEQLNIINE